MSLEDGPYDTFFGGLLVATWINALLYTLEVVQAFRYFRNYSNYDPLKIRLMVAFCVFVDGVNMMSECACVYLYGVTHWGDPPYLTFQNWPVPLSAVATSLTAFTVQTFLIRRYHQLAKQPIITAGLAILSVCAIGGAFACAIMISLDKDFQYRKVIKPPAIMWLALSAGTDTMIATTLIIQLQRMKSGFKSSAGTIRRITVTAIQTGSITTTVAAAALGTFIGAMDTNLSSALVFLLGCSYTLSMLHNLNERRNISGQGTEDSDSTYPNYRREPGSLGLNLTRILGAGRRTARSLDVRLPPPAALARGEGLSRQLSRDTEEERKENVKS